jgi:hypothetical protein
VISISYVIIWLIFTHAVESVLSGAALFMVMETNGKKSLTQSASSKSPVAPVPAKAAKAPTDIPKGITLADLISREVTVQLKDREEQTFTGTLVEFSQWGPVITGVNRGKKFLDLVPWHEVSFVSSVEARANDTDDE